MKIKKMALANGDEFENIELVSNEEILEIKGMEFIRILIDKKEVLINKDFILSIELPRLKAI